MNFSKREIFFVSNKVGLDFVKTLNKLIQVLKELPFIIEILSSIELNLLGSALCLEGVEMLLEKQVQHLNLYHTKTYYITYQNK